LEKVSSNPTNLSEAEHERLESFIEAVEDYDDVQKVWTSAA
jgi:transcriptional/translational regulatory protein YebC/TACO1